MHTALSLILTMRPRQWTKNLIVYAPALFGGVLFEPGVLWRATSAFALLCVLSGAVYIMNDLKDSTADRLYVKTRTRPLASGILDRRTATVAALALGSFALAGAPLLGMRFAAAMVAYAVLQVAYTLWLKRLPVLDVLSIAGGFVLRAVAGAAVADVPDSPWLLVCAALLVSFLALAKRRQELSDLGVQAPAHRPVLAWYSIAWLDVVLTAALGATAASYVVYTLLSEGARMHPYMILTAPFVVFGLIRYAVLARSRESSKSAEDVLLTDVPILLDVIAWVLVVTVLVYLID